MNDTMHGGHGWAWDVYVQGTHRAGPKVCLEVTGKGLDHAMPSSRARRIAHALLEAADLIDDAQVASGAA